MPERKSTHLPHDAYKVWHVAESSVEDGTGVKLSFHRSEMVPNIARALDAAFRIVQRGHRVLHIDGPEDFHMAGADLLHAFEYRVR
jgi:hypothetical protein